MPNTLESLEQVVAALNAAGVRYLIAGGLAVNAHGYPRATHDIDLVLHLERANTLCALRVLAGLGYRPLVPVSLEAFADAQTREGWIRDKGLTVFGLVSDRHPQAPVDVFVSEPFAFEDEYSRALVAEIAPDVSARFVGMDALIRMKRQAGRAKDLDDIQHLEWMAAHGDRS